METRPTYGRISRLTDWRALVLAVWLSLLVAAFAWLFQYSATAGPTGTPPSQWPSESPLADREPGARLLMFAHPRCPCTRSSLRELARVMSQSSPWQNVQVIFFQPTPGGEEWSDTRIIRQARELPGVDITWDPEGNIAARFGVKTSGHVLMYDAAGDLVFSGGITALRNHEGPSAGSAALLALSQGDPPSRSETPVFGCPLLGRSECRVGGPCEAVP